MFFNLIGMLRGFSFARLFTSLLSAFALFMQKSEFGENERIQFQAENTPNLHKIPTRVGVMCTRSDFILSGPLVVSGGTANGTSLGENPGNLALQTLRVQGFAVDSSYQNGTLDNLSPRTLFALRISDATARPS